MTQTALRQPLQPPPAMTPTLEHVFNWLVACAIKGERCPTTDQIRIEIVRAGLPAQGQAPTTALALAGRILVRVHAKNWRVVEILHGEHAGRRTKAAPNHWSCYLVIDRQGVRRVAE
jgi:hypothetical protein